jgi:CheY-like chemotaxis protein
MAETKARILCVEDNKDSREMIATLLTQSNETYDVTAVETAAEALALTAKGSSISISWTSGCREWTEWISADACVIVA